MTRSVVITGVGVVSSAGRGTRALIEALCQSTPVAEHAPGGGSRVDSAVVDLDDLVPARRRRRLGRSARMMLRAVHEALETGAGGRRSLDPIALGMVCGTGFGNLGQTVEFLEQLDREGARSASPSLFPNSVMSATAGQVCLEVGARGYGATICQGEVSGEVAVMLAADALQLGRGGPALLAGGVDEHTPLVEDVCRRLGVASGEIARPYAVDAAGLLLSEGAAVLLLEREVDAVERGATALARIVGYASAGGERALVTAVRGCLRVAGVDPSAVDLVVGSGCGVRARDAREIAALEQIFGGSGGRTMPPLTTTHAAVGTYPADGAQRLAAAVGIFAEGRIFPAGPGGEAAAVASLVRQSRTADGVELILVCGQADTVLYQAFAPGVSWRPATLATAVLLSR